ncbi:class I SAM-dependent methyltransferase [Nocardia huaxiensis]|uniref:class I SAM-dependent methyltransferase n=1 Tax=Nocardia huaxiensis TaxID=2755382 RepID=UPI001E3B259C|nr:class I SAM-dependent methyltransferase [Nocardia huaxiensis]UFS98049.1 class I SAM-dependent methyltransferase [Nocardia huaxiensis]
MTSTLTREPAHRERACRRLLTAARCRFAEDRLADAITAGIDQVVLVGDALDTFCAQNPYRGLRVARIGCFDEESMAGMEFAISRPAFVIHIGGDRTLANLAALVRCVSTLRPGTQLVFDYLPVATPRATVARLLCDTGFEVLEDLGARTLASRYLVLPDSANHSAEPRVVRARIRNNAGRPPSSL